MIGNFVRLVLLVARRDYLRTVRRRGFVAATLLLPVGIALIYGVQLLAFNASTGSKSPILVVNESAIQMTADAQLTPDVVLIDRSQGQSALADGSASGYFVIPSGWPAVPTIQLVVPDRTSIKSPLDALSLQTTEQSQVELMLRVSLLRSSGLPDSVLAQMLTPTTFQTVNQAGEIVTDNSIAATFILPYAFTMIFMLSIIITSGYLLQSVTEEKENRVVEIILSSVPSLPLMAGKVVGLGAAGLTQVVVWLATALIALPFLNQQFSINLGVSPVTIVLAIVLFALGYLAYGAIFAAIGALAPGAREGQQYGSIFGVMAVIPILFMSVFLSDPGSPLVVALCLFPLTAPAAMLQLLAISPSPPWALVAASLLSQVVFVGIAIVASGRIFRATLLLYGVRPSARRIVNAMLARS